MASDDLSRGRKEGRLSEGTVLPILVAGAGAGAARSLTSTIRTISHLSLPPFSSSAPSLVCGWVFSLTSRQAVKFTQRLAEGRAPLHLAPPLQENWSSVSRKWERGRAHFRISRAIEMELNTLPPLLSSLPAVFPHSSTLFPPTPWTCCVCHAFVLPSLGSTFTWPRSMTATVIASIVKSTEPCHCLSSFGGNSRLQSAVGIFPRCSSTWPHFRQACRQAGAGEASPSWSSSLAGLLRQPWHGT